MSKIIFWEDTVSIIKAPFIREVAERWKDEVIVITETDLSANRKKQGWSSPDYSPAIIHIAPTLLKRKKLFENYICDESIHIFSGITAYPENHRTLKKVTNRSNATVGVIAEAGRIDQGMKSWARKYYYKYLAYKWSSRLDFILATGSLGTKWYNDVGFSNKQIFPFGYFVSNHHRNNFNRSAKKENDSPKKFLFVGQISRRKGIDLLIEAFSLLDKKEWRLEIVGGGSEEKKFKKLSEKKGLQDRIIWCGVLPNERVREKMHEADIFILPSRFDGWGAVINEALMAGLPAIVSTNCGSADLVQSSKRGLVFESDSATELNKALKNAINGDLFYNKKDIKNWANRAISPESAAEYFLQVIEYLKKGGTKPLPTWVK